MLVMSQTFYCCGPCSLVTVGGWSWVTWPRQKLVCLPRIQLWLLHFQWNPQTEVPGITLGHFLNVLLWHYNIMGIVVTKSADVERHNVLFFCFRFSNWNWQSPLQPYWTQKSWAPIWCCSMEAASSQESVWLSMEDPQCYWQVSWVHQEKFPQKNPWCHLESPWCHQKQPWRQQPAAEKSMSHPRILPQWWHLPLLQHHRGAVLPVRLVTLQGWQRW